MGVGVGPAERRSWRDFIFLLTPTAKINSTAPLKATKFSGSKAKIAI